MSIFSINRRKVENPKLLNLQKRLSIQSLAITYSRTNILFVKYIILLLWGCFTRMWEVCGVLSDCEELVGEGKPNRFRWEICRHCVVETPEYLNFQFAF